MLIIEKYNSLDNILKFGLIGAIDCIKEAWKAKNNDKIWELYVSLYPNFTSKNYMNFDKFKRIATGDYTPSMTNKEKNRIDREVKRIQEKFRKR